MKRAVKPVTQGKILKSKEKPPRNAGAFNIEGENRESKERL